MALPNMKTNDSRLAGWSFEVEEVSAGVCRVSAVDRLGRRVERTGTEPEKLHHECRRAAEEIERGAVVKGHSR